MILLGDRARAVRAIEKYEFRKVMPGGRWGIFLRGNDKQLGSIQEAALDLMRALRLLADCPPGLRATRHKRVTTPGHVTGSDPEAPSNSLAAPDAPPPIDPSKWL